MKTTTRRGTLGAIAIAPFVLAGLPTPAQAHPVSHTELAKLIAAWRARTAEWSAVGEAEDKAGCALFHARNALPAPVSPGSGLPDDILDLTVREIRDVGDTPEHKAAWAEYEVAKTEHDQQVAALAEEMTGELKRDLSAAWSRVSDAMDAIVAYQPVNLAQLTMKFEVIVEDGADVDVPAEILDTILADMLRLGKEA